MRKIGILTSGGDGPGMNAAIRSIVRSALFRGLQVAGIMRGYQGLIDGDVVDLNHRSVSNIINRGGTILKTARCEEFKTLEGQQKAVEVLKKYQIDALVVIGGDGSYRGAHELFERFGVPTIGLPGTIDNDIYGTDQTIGCQTAINTAIDSIDKIRDTAHSMERIFVVEVMGNRSGYIALQVAVAAGAEEVIVPEKNFDYETLYQNILEGNRKGKVSWIIIVSEGAAKATVVANQITEKTGLETRFVILGHVQRGGSPSGHDRILATRLGSSAVDLLLKGQYGKAVGEIRDELNIIDLKEAKKRPNSQIEEYCELLRKLR
ncbi:MAG: 6-phosphofructokinase [Candidatus Omnitrophica bacterium]|nr:6-phosphofructokinase [Candidatus Omnitrophota bacterium]